MINLTEKTIGLFSQKTKGKILQESLLLFNEQTFNQTTTANIAKSSDVLEGSLWYHFKSKKDLLIEHIKLFESSFKTNIENLKVGNKEVVIQKLFSIYGFVWDFRYIFRDCVKKAYTYGDLQCLSGHRRSHHPSQSQNTTRTAS